MDLLHAVNQESDGGNVQCAGLSAVYLPSRRHGKRQFFYPSKVSAKTILPKKMRKIATKVNL